MLSPSVKLYSVEAKMNDLVLEGVEGVLTATVWRVVSWIQRREEDAGLGDGVAEEIVRTASAVSTTGARHLVLRCSAFII